MALTEEVLRRELNRPSQARSPDVAQLLTQAYRSRRRQRRALRGSAAAAVTAGTSLAMVLLLPSTGSAAALSVGAGSSAGVRNVTASLVEMPAGMFAWRDHHTIYLGYPHGAYTVVDVRQPGVGGADAISTFGDQGVVAGLVHFVPGKVSVAVDGISTDGSIACFRQLPHWCAWSAAIGRSLTLEEMQHPDQHLHVSFS